MCNANAMIQVEMDYRNNGIVITHFEHWGDLKTTLELTQQDAEELRKFLNDHTE